MMLKIKNKTYRTLSAKPLAAAALLLLSACAAEEEPQVAGSSTGSQLKTPIELSAGIVGEGGAAMTRGNNPALTRSVTTIDKPYNQYAQAFSKGTSFYMVMKSTENDDATLYTRTIGYGQMNVDASNTDVYFAEGYNRYYEDSHSRASQLSVYSACVPGYYLAGSVFAKPSTYDGEWPNGTLDATTWTVGSSSTYANAWSGSASLTTIAWPIDRTADDDVTSQTANFLNSQDLCFSNNVSKYQSGTNPETDAPVYTDNRIKFDEGIRKFTGKRLVFYHALTMVTFKIKKGEGFEGATFNFTDNGTSTTSKNFVMVGFNTSGTFDITDGEFESTSSTTINKLHITEDNRATSGTYAYVISGLLVPGSDLNASDKDDTHTVHFELDGNLYHVTKKQLADALATKTLSDGTTPALETPDGTVKKLMRPGVHYVFEMTVGKRKMDHLTASVVPWEDVEAAETTPSNARIVVSLLKNGTLQRGSASFDLYRKADVADAVPATTEAENAYASFQWNTGYAPAGTPDANRADLTETGTDTGIYKADEFGESSTPWYWPDNKTFYHFRAVMPKNTTVTEDETNGDYISLTGESIATYGADDYTGTCWGAPFKHIDVTEPANQRLAYSTETGFDNTQNIGANPDAESNHQISKAIGVTENTIDMELFHMMSDVTIQLTTTAGTDAVTLAGATVRMSNIYNSGLVRMGTGKVETTGAIASPEIGGTVTLHDTKYKWRYAFVPQSLATVVLTIKTTDNNLYLVDMKDVVASSIGSNVIAAPTYADNKINRWYPNYRYTYTFKLTKSDISLITATLADWEDVTAGDDNVQIR